MGSLTTTREIDDLPWERRGEQLLKRLWEFEGDGKEERGWLVEVVLRVERGTKKVVVVDHLVPLVGRKVAEEGWGCRELDLLGSNRQLVEGKGVEVAAAAAAVGEGRGPAAAEELVAVEDGEG